MSNQWFLIVASKRIIVKEKENKIIKTNHFITIWSIVTKALRKIIFQLPRKLDNSVVVNI